jgi:hypothetical protein
MARFGELCQFKMSNGTSPFIGRAAVISVSNHGNLTGYGRTYTVIEADSSEIKRLFLSRRVKDFVPRDWKFEG